MNEKERIKGILMTQMQMMHEGSKKAKYAGADRAIAEYGNAIAKCAEAYIRICPEFWMPITASGLGCHEETE